jgi:putative endonuclease
MHAVLAEMSLAFFLLFARPMKPMLAPHLEFGRATEDAALQYFIAQTGAKLIARNYGFRGGEIDLIFESKEELVFIEVRGRATDGMLQGFESILWRKQRRIEKAIRHFLFRYEGRAKKMRLDVLSWDGKSWTHLKNVWI